MASEFEITKRVFARAIRLEAAKRRAFLEKSRLSESVRREVEVLLVHHERKERVLGIPTSVGGKLLSHYRILEQIGGGGMGLVYKALDERLDRLVAVKVLPPWAMGNQPSRARFLEEARCAGALNHPHIVTIHEVGRENDIDFIVMEYISGKTLDQHIPARGVPLAKALTWGLQIGSALEAAHAIGILHRDLKPSNVMVTHGGDAKLVDFGLALRRGTAVEKSNFGTKDYMAPELLSMDSVPDQRSEVFSFGIVLFHMLAGRIPFAKFSAIAVNSRLSKTSLPESIKKHTAIVQTVRKCLEEDPCQRFQSIKEVIASLRNASDLAQPSRLPQEPLESGPDLGAAKELRITLRKISKLSLGESRRAYARVIMLLNTTTPDTTRQVVVSSMKELLLRPLLSGEGMSHAREVRKLALELLRTATRGSLHCFDAEDLEHLDLYGMNFAAASLQGLSFKGSFLVEADFRECGLRGASFAGASIRNVDFTGADLVDVDFTEADWFHATGLTEDQLSQARKNNLRPCPPTIQDMHRHLVARYAVPFSSWSDHVQDEITRAWELYLRPGGLRDTVARWRAVS